MPQISGVIINICEVTEALPEIVVNELVFVNDVTYGVLCVSSTIINVEIN